jgi:sucrose phosphorylase
VLTQFATPSGEKNVWTTFSADQIDLNYHNPDVLLDMLDTLLFYVEHGAEFLRLDAIAYLWKEIGTPCINLPQTHHVIQLVRAVLDEIAPQVKLITETNVPHTENISYFGDGSNEAQLVYNFALPPLVLHTFQTANASTLSRWASKLTLPSNHVTFFNFLASHDGIGVNPARGILGDSEIDALVARAQAHRGLVSYKTNHDGTSSPYELNVNYFDALSDPNANDPLDTQVTRFITAQAIMLSLVGVPGIYFHSLFGSRGWREGPAATGQNRAINRAKFARGVLERELADPMSRRWAVFTRYCQLLRPRTMHPAFNPYSSMRILDIHPSIFSVLRVDARDRPVLCLHNVSDQLQNVELKLRDLFSVHDKELADLITDERFDMPATLRLAPYQTLWLTSIS